MPLHNKLSKVIVIKSNKFKFVQIPKYKSCIYKEPINYFFKQNHEILQNFGSQYINYINNFLNTLEKNPNIDLNLFYNNLRTLSIKEKKNFNRLIFLPTNMIGSYSLKKNQIALIKTNYNLYIFHELLHCASCKRNKNIYSTGFFKQFPKTSIGRALNEGYTSLLEKRYFIQNSTKNTYQNMRFIAHKIEVLIGKDIMEKLYFTADLNGLINEFTKYGKSKREIIFFIDELDYIRFNLGNPDNKNYCQVALYDITKFLIDCYRKKCVTDDKTIPKLDNFINSLQKQINANEISYNFLNLDFTTDQTNKNRNYYINDFYIYKKYYKK